MLFYVRIFQNNRYNGVTEKPKVSRKSILNLKVKMKKFCLVLIALFCVIFTAAAQKSGKFQATEDLPSLDISKGDVVYITFDRKNGIEYFRFENLSNYTSFAAISTGGMGGSRNGYNFTYFKIEGVSNSIQIQWIIDYKYNLGEVKIGSCRFIRL